MRAPFQILAIPYRRGAEPAYCVLRRSDLDQWQFVAGGGEDDETPLETAVREISEETGIITDSVIQLTSMAYVPANVISERYRQYWPKNTYVLPEYHFAFECVSELRLSDEHTGCEWLSFDDAMSRLTWDSNKTALYELRCRLMEES